MTKTTLHDYYAILGVPKSASTAQIKHAYRKLATVHHPDKAGDSRYIVLINEAYAILKDPKKRHEYDAYHALYFSKAGKVATTLGEKLQQSPTIMAHLKSLERQATAFAQFAEYELKPVFIKNAKTLFAKAQNFIHKHKQTLPTLIISQTLAKDGGQITFSHHNQTIRTTLPKGLTDGSQIKLTIDGVGVWFVIKVDKLSY